MNTNKLILRAIVIVLVLAGAVFAYLSRPAAEGGAGSDSGPDSGPAVATALPRLLDLGADKCIPCKAMAPILAELDSTFAGVFEVEFIDVWKNPAAAEPYGLKMIPTQIFFAADGTELFRHQGFFSREDILAKWTELGVALPAAGG